MVGGSFFEFGGLVGGSFFEFGGLVGGRVAIFLALRAESTGYIGITCVCGFPPKLAILA